MTHPFRFHLLLLGVFVFFSSAIIYGQDKENRNPQATDSVKEASSRSDKAATDTSQHKKHQSNASKASIRSAILPGWGQAYNKKYWKIPIVYGALAIPVATFTYNLKWYNKTKYAYTVRYNKDTANYGNIDPELQPLSTDALRLYRDDFRKNMDYSILAFLVIWGLNVADAAVDAHLKDFNVSEDLSLRIHPGYSPAGNTTGISLILAFRDKPLTKRMPW